MESMENVVVSAVLIMDGEMLLAFRWREAPGQRALEAAARIEETSEVLISFSGI